MTAAQATTVMGWAAAEAAITIGRAKTVELRPALQGALTAVPLQPATANALLKSTSSRCQGLAALSPDERATDENVSSLAHAGAILETLELKLTQEGDGVLVASVSEGGALLEELFSLLSSLEGLAPEDSDYLEGMALSMVLDGSAEMPTGVSPRQPFRLVDGPRLSWTTMGASNGRNWTRRRCGARTLVAAALNALRSSLRSVCCR